MKYSQVTNVKAGDVIFTHSNFTCIILFVTKNTITDLTFRSGTPVIFKDDPSFYIDIRNKKLI